MCSFRAGAKAANLPPRGGDAGRAEGGAKDRGFDQLGFLAYESAGEAAPYEGPLSVRIAATFPLLRMGEEPRS